MEFLVPRIQALLHFRLHPSQDIWICPKHCFALMLSEELVTGLSRSVIRQALNFSTGEGLVLTFHNDGNRDKRRKTSQRSVYPGRSRVNHDRHGGSAATVFLQFLDSCFCSGLGHSGVQSSPLSFHTSEDSQSTSTPAPSPLEVRGKPTPFL